MNGLGELELKLNKKKLLRLFILLIILYFTTEWIVRGIYYVLFRSHTYTTFASPMVHLTKYFVIAILLIVLFKRHAILAPAGRKLIPMFLVLSIAGGLITALWFNAANEQKLVKYRIAWWSVHTWDEVDYISPDIYLEYPMRSDLTTEPARLITKYNIHFKDGSAMNVWDNLHSVYNLHQFALDIGIKASYSVESQLFDQNYAHYFKKSLPEAHFIYGIEETDPLND